MTRSWLFLSVAVTAATLWHCSLALAEPDEADPSTESRELATQFEDFGYPRPPTRGFPDTESSVSNWIPVNAFPEGDGPAAIVLTPDARLALIAHQDTATLGVIDTQLGQSIAEIPVGQYPQGVAVTPDGARAITANSLGNSISIVNLASRALERNVAITGQFPYRVAVTPDGQRAVVGIINDAVNSAFAVVNISTGSVERTIPSAPQGEIASFFTPETGAEGYFYTQFTLTPDSSRILLLDRVNSRLVSYSISTGAQLSSTPVPQWPTGIDVTPDGRFALISHEVGQRRVSRVDLQSGVVTQFVTPGDLFGQVVRSTPDGSGAVVLLSGGVGVVDFATAQVSQIPLAQPQAIASIDGSRMLVVGSQPAIVNVASRSIERLLEGRTMFLAAAGGPPSAPIGIGLDNRLGERVEIYSLSVDSAALRWRLPTGPRPEADAPRGIVLSPDGRTGVALNNSSANVSIIDLRGERPTYFVDVGERPLDAAFSPDGRWLVVPSADNAWTTIIDLSTTMPEVAAVVPVASRPVRAVVSPDGSRCYVLCIDSDVVSVISLEGRSSRVIGQLAAGKVGFSGYFSYFEFTGMTLSPDGSVLAVCDNGGRFLRLFNTQSLSQVAAVSVGTSPVRVIFNAAGDRAYVANAGSDNISIVEVNGAASTRLANVSAGDSPLSMALDTDERFLYVGAFGLNQPGIAVIDTLTATQADFIDLNGYRVRELRYSPNCGMISAIGTGDFDDQFFRILARGASSVVTEILPLSWTASDLEVSGPLNLALAAQPVLDQIDLFHLPANADLDFNGAVDFADFLIFSTAYDAGLTLADLNADGGVDFGDFLIFLEAYDAGCR